MRKRLLCFILSNMLIFSSIPVYAAETNKETGKEDDKVLTYKEIELGFDPTFEENPKLDYDDYNPNELDFECFNIRPEGNNDSEMPIKYRSDDDGLITSLKNQNPTGLCWAFSALGAAETNMIKKELDDTNADYSESQLAYYFYNKPIDLSDKTGNTSGDYNRTPYDYSTIGGNGLLTIWHLAGWNGPVSESNDKEDYTFGSFSKDMSLENTADSLMGNDIAHLQNSYIVASNDKNSMKYMITTYGSVTSAYCSSDLYDSIKNGMSPDDEGAYYCYEDKKTNHAIQIIGWDDEYDKTLFNADTEKQPSENGAWLVRNSWGGETSNSSQDGLFWLSYEDKSLDTFSISFDMEPADNYDNIYQYDGSACYSVAYPAWESNNPKVATIFEAKANGENSEQLKSVGIGCGTTNSEYTLKIYKYDKNTDINKDIIETGAPVLTQTGVLGHSGYHTIPLEKTIYLSAGQKYGIVFEFKNKTLLFDDKTDDSLGWITFTNNTENEYCYEYRENDYVDIAKDESRVYRIKGYTTNCDNKTGVIASNMPVSMTKGDTLDVSLNITDDVIITSSDEDVISVDNTTLTAVNNGTATISINYNGVSDDYAIEVNNALKSISFESDKYLIGIGATEELTVIYNPDDTTDDKSLIWESSNPEYVTVNDGVIKGIKEGTATITARCGDKTAEIEVTVGTDITDFFIESNNKSLIIGDEEEIAITLNPSTTTITDDNIKFKIENVIPHEKNKTGNVIEYDAENKKVTAVGAGSAKLVASYKNISKTIDFTVNKAIESVTLKYDNKEISENDVIEVDLNNRKSIELAFGPDDYTESPIYNFVYDSSTIMINNNNEIIGKTVGETNVTFKCRDIEKTFKVKVSNPVSMVSLNKTKLALNVGDKFKLLPTITPANATNKTLIWTSSDTDVATVDQDGIIEARNVGTAKISVSSINNKKAICNITVTEKANPIIGFELSFYETNMKEGEILPFTIKIIAKDTSIPTTEDINIVWESTNESVAYIKGNKIYALKEGKALLTGTLNNHYIKDIEVTVTKEITSISIPSNLTIKVGQSTSIDVTSNPSKTINVDWVIEDKNIIKYEDGKFYGLKPGMTKVYAKYGNLKSFNCLICVETNLEKLLLEDDNITLEPGVTYKINPKTYPEGNYNINYKSSDVNIATVDDNGTVKTHNTGTAIISITCENKGIICVINVKEKPAIPVLSPAKNTSITINTQKIGSIQTINSNKYKISSKTNASYNKAPLSKKKITIADAIIVNGIRYKINTIDTKAFKNNKKVNSVIIGKNVKTIGADAFRNCKNLKSMTIYSTKISKVGKNAFKGCNKNLKIKVPKSKVKKYQKLFGNKVKVVSL